MQNTLEPKPRFTLHRIKNGSPVTADPTDLTTILIRGAIHCSYWLTVDGFVKLAGGASPTVTLIPLMVAKYEDAAGAEQEEYVVQGTAIGPLSDGESFQVETYRGRLYLRIDVVTGNPTNVQVLLGGAKADNGGPR